MVANEAAESVLKNDHPNIIEYHKSLPSTAQYLSVSPAASMSNGLIRRGRLCDQWSRAMLPK